MNRKPIIGVPADRRFVDGQAYHMVGEKYLQALIDGAGAMPFEIPVLAEHLDMGEVIEEIDGLFLTGSASNVEPHHYDGSSSVPGTLHDPHRDAATLPLAKRAMEIGMPVFAVCRGFQELNVALGGTLHQQVQEVEGYHTHKENPDDPLDVQYGPAHAVNLVEGGLLRGLAGQASVMVNSLHSQGVARLAEGVTVEAVADDGLIESFTVDSAAGFATAVQWHPEWRVTENDFSLALFRAFGNACSEYAMAKRRG